MLGGRAYDGGWLVSELLDRQGLELDPTLSSLWLLRTTDGFVSASAVTPLAELGLDGRAVLIVVNQMGVLYPLLMDPSFGGAGLRLEALGTSQAWRLDVQGNTVVRMPTTPFAPGR